MTKLATKLTSYYIAAQERIQDGIDRISEQPEAGLDDAAWKAIWITVGAAAAVTLTGVVITWASGYLSTKLGSF